MIILAVNMRCIIFLWICLCSVLSGCTATGKNELTNNPDTAYLFTYFTKNGEDGLHLAVSRDGYDWQKLPRVENHWRPVIGKSKLMRDPCVVQGPDGTYHMVWTSGWNENNIGYASTQDFIHWSEQKEIPVMLHEPQVRNAWAPEIIYDEKHNHFVIFWSSTIPDKFPETAASSEDNYNHRLYYTTTRDFVDFTPTQLFYDPGFSVIDATFLKFNQQLHLIIKDETRFPPKKYLQLAKSASLTGPFAKPGVPVTREGFWVEGPTAVQLGDYAVIYFDAYTNKQYGAIRSKDLVHWEDVSAKMHFPDEGTPLRMRHGTVIPVPLELIEKLESKK